MTPKISTELLDALRQQGSPLEVHDDQTNTDYVLVSKQEYRQLIEHEFVQWLQVGLDQESRGEVAEWDVASIRAEAGRRLAERQRAS